MLSRIPGTGLSLRWHRQSASWRTLLTYISIENAAISSARQAAYPYSVWSGQGPRIQNCGKAMLPQPHAGIELVPPQVRRENERICLRYFLENPESAEFLENFLVANPPAVAIADARHAGCSPIIQPLRHKSRLLPSPWGGRAVAWSVRAGELRASVVTQDP